MKDRLYNIFIAIMLSFSILFLIYCGIFFFWNKSIQNRLDREGVPAIATIINRYGDIADYDVYYDGAYYKDFIVLSKKAMHQIKIGERFRAVVLPDKLKYHHNGGITPSYIRIILVPLPLYEQDIEGELNRIDSMYKNSKMRSVSH